MNGIKLTPTEIQHLIERGLMSLPVHPPGYNAVQEVKKERMQRWRDANVAKGLRSDGKPMMGRYKKR